MSESTSPALETALAYHHAWTGGDFERAMTYIADDITCHSPAGRLVGAAAFRQFMGPFAGTLTESHLFAAFGDDTTALLMYHTDTIPVKNAPGAECLTIADGKIIEMRIIFDRLPFEMAHQAATTG